MPRSSCSPRSEADAFGRPIASAARDSVCHGVAHHHLALEELRHVGGARHLVHGAADHAEFQPLRRAGIAEHHVAEMNADAEGDRLPPRVPALFKRGEPALRVASGAQRARAGLRLAEALAGKKARIASPMMSSTWPPSSVTA